MDDKEKIKTNSQDVIEIPKNVIFDEEIDITNYINFDFGKRIRYRIICVCTHLGSSGSYGHYIAFCRHRLTGKWYKFNDSSCSQCSLNEIYGGSPYLLLYEHNFIILYSSIKRPI